MFASSALPQFRGMSQASPLPAQSEPDLTPCAVRRKRIRRVVIVCVLAIFTLPTIRGVDILAGQNFHTVSAGQVYRSGQLSAAQLEGRIKEQGLRTVINLRGPNPGKDWYDDETAVCRRLGIEHVDIRLSARELPDKAEATKLLEALHTAPRPLLVHCLNGADRSGLASAAYLIQEEGRAPEQAVGSQLNLWYGHMPVGRTQSMEAFFADFERSGSPRMRDWLTTAYVPRP